MVNFGVVQKHMYRPYVNLFFRSTGSLTYVFGFIPPPVVFIRVYTWSKILLVFDFINTNYTRYLI